MQKFYTSLIGYNTLSENYFKNGIYMIYFLNNKKKYYIGSVFRKIKQRHRNGFYGRLKEHVLLLIKNRHHSIHLQNAFNKNGLSNLKFDFIEECFNVEDCRNKENYYINFYDSYKNGYNCTPESKSVVLSEIQRLSSSIRMKNNNPMKNKETVNKMKKSRKMISKLPVLQYDFNGVFINLYDSVFDASVSVGVDSSNIFRASKGNTNSSGGYIWIYKKDFSDFLLKTKVQNLKIKKKRTLESIVLGINKIKKKVGCFTRNNEELMKFDSIKEAANYYKIDPGNISNVCNGKQKTYKNMIWKFI